MVLAHAGKADDLPLVLDLVHDWWFDLSAVSWDPQTGVATVDLYPTQSELEFRSADARRLMVRSVAEVSINDEAHIEFYDLNTLVSNGHELILDSCVPLQIVFRLTGALDLSVVQAE